MTSNEDLTAQLQFTVVSVLVFGVFSCICRIVYDHCKSKQERPISLIPMVPFPQFNLRVFYGTDNLENIVPEARIQVDDRKNENSDFLKRINSFMAWTFELQSRLPQEYEEVPSKTNEKCYRIKPIISVPDNVRTISIKMDGYEHGQMCHDFEPTAGAARGSHCTYQMYGDNRIQVTRYVVDGKSEIAGFCIYIENPRVSLWNDEWTFLYNLARSVKMTENPRITEERRNERIEPKIEVVPEENINLISEEPDDREWTGKYCSKLRRIVLTNTDSSGVVLHQEWSDRNNQMRIEKCEECTKEGLEKEEQPPTYSSIFVA